MTVFDPTALQMLRDPQITTHQRQQLAGQLTDEEVETAFDQDLLTVDEAIEALAAAEGK
jgi:hypothetical protein